MSLLYLTLSSDNWLFRLCLELASPSLKPSKLCFNLCCLEAVSAGGITSTFPYITQADGDHVVIQSLMNPDLIVAIDFHPFLAQAAMKDQDTACGPACNSHYSQPMETLINITNTLYFDESTTRLEEGNKISYFQTHSCLQALRLLLPCC